MLGLGKPKPIAEYEARGEVERVYYEITQVLRVRGVNLNFRTWAGYGDFLPAMWDAVRPSAETMAFEDAADRLRADAVTAADGLGRLDALAAVRLGESQRWHIQRSLDLYHYVNPKLLVLTSAVRLALLGEAVGTAGLKEERIELIERGPAADMLPLEMVEDPPDDPQVRQTFDSIQKTLALPTVNSDYRTLALWPDYLTAVWERLKPVAQRHEYQQSSNRLRELSRELARSLPLGVPLSGDQVRELGEKPEAILDVTERFEQLLPGLILNIALCALDWRSPAELRESPYPPAVRRGAPGGAS